jgi:hypothetical protein
MNYSKEQGQSPLLGNTAKSSVGKPAGNLDLGACSLPCLNSNISTEIPPETFQNLSTQHRKTAFVLRESVQKLADQYGIERLGFLTLTFSEHILDPVEAQRRLNSLITHVIKQRYFDYLGVFERQKSGRIHYHFLVVLGKDIRTGFDFGDIAKGSYKSASSDLRSEWAFWRKTAKAYGFGRTELLPVKSNIEAMAKYVGKYISKHIEAREYQDKGVRLVRYSRGARAGTTRFQFNTDGASEWRRKVAIFAELVRSRYPDQQVDDVTDLSRVLGARWAYRNGDFIHSLP